MAGSVNKVILIGNLGADPDIRSMQSGDEVVNLSIATSENWKDKNTGERREKTEWHRVVIFNKGLVSVCKNYLKKGAKVYIEGQLQTRSWEQEGQKKYTTEVVLSGFNGQLTMLDGRSGGGQQQGMGGGGFNDSQSGSYDSGFGNNNTGGGSSFNTGGSQSSNTQIDELEDEIPF